MNEARELTRLAKQLLAAKQKITNEQIEQRLESLNIRSERSDGPDANGPWVTMSFRNRDYFTDREPEWDEDEDEYEDDDHPDFTGYDVVMKKVKAHFDDWLKKRLVEVSVESEEKSWFSVSVRAK